MTGCECDKNRVYTVEDWLFDCVNFEIPQSGVNFVCAKRKVEPSTVYGDYLSMADDKKMPDIRLLKADLIKWIVLGPGKVGGTKDSDNGWSHSDNGYELSPEDKKLLMGEANDIYEELEPESVFGKKKIRMRSAGIMPAYRNYDGEPLPRRPL